MSSYTLLVLQSVGVFTPITEIDIRGNVILPLVLIIGLLVTCEMASMTISPLTIM